MSETIDCAFLGRLNHDPELKRSAAGKSWCRISLAVGYGDAIERVSCALFGENAEYVCRSMTKNDKLYIEGAIGLNEWTSRDGEKRTGLSVVASKAEAPAIGRNKPQRPRQPASNSQADASTRDWQRPIGAEPA